MSFDNARSAQVERDLEQAIIALKKGAYLLKYGRRGKPKFCPFRLANDESVLIWFSDKEEKQLKLSQVSRIIPGQRTAIFQRYPRPEKECQSFSLIYHDRSLDLICKDKDEAEVWFAGLKALIARIHQRKWRAESRSDSVSSEASSPRAYICKSSPLSSPLDGSSDDIRKDGDLLRLSPSGSPSKNAVDEKLYNGSHQGIFPRGSAESSIHSSSSGGSYANNINKYTRGAPPETFRVSLSSAVSSSSQGSGQDDGDALGDVFIWGEGTGDGFLGSGTHKIVSFSGAKMDSLRPKALDSPVILDVRSISCGGRYGVLVTKQGEIYSWGEELGGRLGHGIDADVSQPKLIEALSNMNVESVACGERHTCAVTLSGDLYTWGDGSRGHWIPRRVDGPLYGLHVSSVSCGAWHTAVVTSSGQLFTFGDGTFGVLGHGDRRSVSTPREVDSLKGLRTVRAACGVWHTAAVVEVITGHTGYQNASSSGKLFTWGDGDKGRLGHGDKEPRFLPTCVASLIEASFCRVACGHSMTVGLTTSGHVYTIGSPVYGQLGNPQADGKHPVCVGGKLSNSFVEEISCGAYHVAVLTSRTEVYTWGKGANGRLGHGDTHDRNAPALVEALKDRQVRSIVCGADFTACICAHKWTSGVDQSMCSGCRMPFSFKRKRHNCYHCGLLFCHSCSSKRSLRASMAPNPGKPHRVCDNCFIKLKRVLETEAPLHVGFLRKASLYVGDQPDKEEKDAGYRILAPKISTVDSLKRNNKLELRCTHVPQITGDSCQSSSISKTSNPVFGSSKKFFSSPVPVSKTVSLATSLVTERPNFLARSTTPTPTPSGLISIDEGLTASESLSQEVVRLRSQVESLICKSQRQDMELERSEKKLKEAMAVAEEEAAKCKAAKDVIKALTAELKEMAQRLPVGMGINGKLPSNAPVETTSEVANQTENPIIFSHESDSNAPSLPIANGSNFGGKKNHIPTIVSHGSDPNSPRLQVSDASNSDGKRSSMDDSENTRNGTKYINGDISAAATEWVEQDEPGVYITFISLSGGARDLKRVRFSAAGSGSARSKPSNGGPRIGREYTLSITSDPWTEQVQVVGTTRGRARHLSKVNGKSQRWRI
ncbi:PH, RCC1 and FYVE domains-containing protein 1-like isoform X2 [Wolffia australiana]